METPTPTSDEIRRELVVYAKGLPDIPVYAHRTLKHAQDSGRPGEKVTAYRVTVVIQPIAEYE